MEKNPSPQQSVIPTMVVTHQDYNTEQSTENEQFYDTQEETMVCNQDFQEGV